MINKKGMIKNYKEINKDYDLGWKIKNILKIQNDFNIPKWFIITDKYDINERLFREYKENINSKFYICRSSMNNEDSKELSYAWLFESIEWKYSEKLLLKDIQYVFDSINNNFLDEYEQKIIWKKIFNRKMNVLVQEFIVWEVSWVYFSDYKWNRLLEYIKWCNQFLVEWIVKSNSITLDKMYNIKKHSINKQYKYIWENLDVFIYNKKNNCLEDNTLNSLILELKKLKKFFNFEIDVEWTIVKWVIYILQVRPITNI